MKCICYDRETHRRGRIGCNSGGVIPTLTVKWDGDTTYVRVLLSSVIGSREYHKRKHIAYRSEERSRRRHRLTVAKTASV